MKTPTFSASFLGRLESTICRWLRAFATAMQPLPASERTILGVRS